MYEGSFVCLYGGGENHAPSPRPCSPPCSTSPPDHHHLLLTTTTAVPPRAPSVSICPLTDSFADRRVKLLRGAVRRPLFRPALPAALVENSPSCPTSSDSGGWRVLPDGSPWLTELYEAIADVALSNRRPYK